MHLEIIRTLKLIPFLLLGFGFFNPVFSQKKSISVGSRDSYTQDSTIEGIRVCYSAEHEKTLRNKYPNLGTRNDFERSLNKIISARKALRTEDNQIDTIPVIVHIIHNGDAVGFNENLSQAQVNSQFDILNNDYGRISGTPGFNTLSFSGDSFIRFAPAVIDPSGKDMAEPGIDRVFNNTQTSWDVSTIDSDIKPKSQWDPNKYLNIWTVVFGGSSSNLLGYAQFPERANSGLSDLQTSQTANTDGVVISFRTFGNIGNVSTKYNGGRSASHEIGHFLGLYHTWGDESDCSGTDFCADTPPCSDANYSSFSACTAPVQCKNNRLISNYMDYSDDGCMNNFTSNQITRMKAVLSSSPRRASLKSSKLFRKDFSPSPAFTQNKRLISEGDSITFTDNSSNNPTQWNFGVLETGNPYAFATFAGASFKYKFENSGVYDISLTSGNSQGQRTIKTSQNVGVISKKSLWIPFSEDFQNESISLKNWITFNLDTISNWKFTPEQLTLTPLTVASVVIGSDGKTTKAYYCDNYEDDFSGTSDAIISPNINLSGLTSPKLTFDVAYSTIKVSGIVYMDTLQILITTNSGASFTKIWEKSGTTLATTLINNRGFVPTNKNLWRNETISLSNFLNIGGFNLAIVNRSGYANNLYIDNISITATSSSPPVSNFYTDYKTVCTKNLVQFIDSSTNIPTSWSWNISGATQSTHTTQNPIVSFNNSGVFDVQLQTSNGAGTGTTVTKIQYVNVIESPTLVYENKILTTSLTSGIQWYNGNFAIPGATTSSFTPSTSGNYTVVNTMVGPNCKSNSRSVLLDIKENTNILADITEILIFPNPSTDQMQISVQNKIGTNELDVTFYSLMGNEVTIPITNTEELSTKKVDVSGLSSGTYIAKVIVNGKNHFKRWVKL